jgi:hypothetical protein
VGPGYPIGVRLSANEFVQGGLQPAETAEIAQMVEPDVDYINVSTSGYYRLSRINATMEAPFGYELPDSEIVTKAVAKPTLVTGRVLSLDHAEHILSSGQADLVSMVRALIADPDLVRKSREGREAEVRPCIGSAQGCLGHDAKNGFQMTCVMNVSTGFETTIPSDTPEPAATRRKVMIVGGGPAGLEAARTAALRGHEVVLYELKRQLGGQVSIAASAPLRADLAAATNWLADEARRLGVVIHLSSAADPDVIAQENPDVLVVAAGSTPRTDGFQTGRPVTPFAGFDLPHVYNSWDVLGSTGRATIGRQAVIYDDTGTYEAVSVADALIAAGSSVTFLTRFDTIGSNVPGTVVTLGSAKERLFNGPFQLVPHMLLREVTPTTVVATVAQGTKEMIFPADTVVVVTPNIPNRELLDYLGDFHGELHVVGDVNGTASLQRAIRAGHLAVRSS